MKTSQSSVSLPSCFKNTECAELRQLSKLDSVDGKRAHTGKVRWNI